MVVAARRLAAADHHAVIADRVRPTGGSAQRAKIDHAGLAGPQERMADIAVGDAAPTHDRTLLINRVGRTESSAEGTQVDHALPLGPLEGVIGVIRQIAVTHDDAGRAHRVRRTGEAAERAQVDQPTNPRPDEGVIRGVSRELAVAGDHAGVRDGVRPARAAAERTEVPHALVFRPGEGMRDGAVVVDPAAADHQAIGVDRRRLAESPAQGLQIDRHQGPRRPAAAGAGRCRRRRKDGDHHTGEPRKRQPRLKDEIVGRSSHATLLSRVSRVRDRIAGARRRHHAPRVSQVW